MACRRDLHQGRRVFDLAQPDSGTSCKQHAQQRDGFRWSPVRRPQGARDVLEHLLRSPYPNTYFKSAVDYPRIEVPRLEPLDDDYSLAKPLQALR